MIWLTDAEDYDGRPSVVALGTFDGLHLGHARLIREAVELARSRGVVSIVCAFDRHPLALFAPERAPRPLLSAGERAELIRTMGVDVLIERPFDRATAGTEAAEYLRQMKERLNPCVLVAGPNHTFGRGGVGDASLLARLGESLGYEARIVPPVELDGEPVSSTRVRSALGAGDMTAFRRLTGRDFLLPLRRGVLPADRFLPPDGRYEGALDGKSAVFTQRAGRIEDSDASVARYGKRIP